MLLKYISVFSRYPKQARKFRILRSLCFLNSASLYFFFFFQSCASHNLHNSVTINATCITLYRSLVTQIVTVIQLDSICSANLLIVVSILHLTTITISHIPSESLCATIVSAKTFVILFSNVSILYSRQTPQLLGIRT